MHGRVRTPGKIHMYLHVSGISDTYLVIGIASVEPVHWCTSFQRHVWFPPIFAIRMLFFVDRLGVILVCSRHSHLSKTQTQAASAVDFSCLNNGYGMVVSCPVPSRPVPYRPIPSRPVQSCPTPSLSSTSSACATSVSVPLPRQHGCLVPYSVSTLLEQRSILQMNRFQTTLTITQKIIISLSLSL